MRVLFTLFTALMFIGNAHAQVVSVNTSAKVTVPADKIAFQVNLNATADTPQQAYKIHKKREKVLVGLLKKYNIKDKDIDFEPISINKVYNRNKDKEQQVKTRQSVVLTLSDLDKYEKMQIVLIDNNFDDFSGRFLSSKADDGEDKALQKALSLARHKADIIARQIGSKISGVKKVNYSYNHYQPRPVMEMKSMQAYDSGLLDFDQTVNVSAQVSVTYQLYADKSSGSNTDMDNK